MLLINDHFSVTSVAAEILRFLNRPSWPGYVFLLGTQLNFEHAVSYPQFFVIHVFENMRNVALVFILQLLLFPMTFEHFLSKSISLKSVLLSVEHEVSF